MAMPQFMPQDGPNAMLTEEERRRLLMAQSQPGPRYVPTPDDDDTPAPSPAPTADRMLEARRETPVYSPPNIIGNESALIKRPPMTMADYYTEHATPIENLERPRTATEPPATPTGPTVVYGDKGQPRGVEGGGSDYEKDRAYLQALQHYKPENHNSRFKSAMLGFARGFQGIRGQSLIGNLVDPAADERYANEAEIARVGRSVSNYEEQQKRESDLERQRSENALRDAQAQKALREPTYAPHYLENVEGGPMVAQGNRATPIYDPQGNAIKGKPKPTASRTKVVYNQETGKAETWTLDESGKPKEMISGGDPKLDLVKRDGMWVPQGTALNADATRDNRTYQRNRDTFQDNRRAQERIEDKTERNLDRGEQRRKDAGSLTGKIDAARRRAEDASKKIAELEVQIGNEKNAGNKLVLQQSLEAYKFDRQKAFQEAEGAATDLRNSYGDMFEAGPGDADTYGNRWPYYKKRPLSLSAWRAKYPRATKQQEEAWKANAAAAGMEVGP